MHEFFTTANLVALLTLTSLEIVLGIDNIVFLSIITGKLPVEKRAKARTVGLAMAMLMRIALLLAITWVMSLTNTLFTLIHHDFSGKDLILFFGGLFLVAKATHEIHERMEGEKPEGEGGRAAPSFMSVIIQITVLDIVFSLDSVITAVGMAKHVETMIAAVVIAVMVMMAFSGKVSSFIERHPTLKMLALSFLILIGVMLIAEAVGQHVDKGYIYFAMAFALGVEMLNIRLHIKKREHHL
ncbi:MAG TPA: TerC family protein [Planctomycetota bacterium]|nr:TerC family protein [Planctomycetota bacterium]